MDTHNDLLHVFGRFSCFSAKLYCCTALRNEIDTYVNAVLDEYAIKTVMLTLEVIMWAVVIKLNFRNCSRTVSPIIAGFIYVITFGRQGALYFLP